MGSRGKNEKPGRGSCPPGGSNQGGPSVVVVEAFNVPLDGYQVPAPAAGILSLQPFFSAAAAEAGAGGGTGLPLLLTVIQACLHLLGVGSL